MINYIQAVCLSGGVPIPGYAPQPDPSCRALLLCGGGDLAPQWFGQENRGSHPPDLHRDKAELNLVRTYLTWGRPILGICRGLQVLNVALGGTLLQDLGPERSALHQGPQDVFHPIRTREASLLEQLFGPSSTVNSAHHQGANRLGRDLVSTAWAPDGTVEGLEHQGAPAVGVQFHPERLPGHPAAARALFQWLITQAAAVPLC